MDDVAPSTNLSTSDTTGAAAAAPPAAAKARSPVSVLRTVVADFQIKMVEAQTKEFGKIKKSLGKLLAVPVIIRIAETEFVLESFENPDVFFTLGKFNEDDLPKYEHIFGKGRPVEQVRECLDATYEAHQCMANIGYFAANKISEVRIVA